MWKVAISVACTVRAGVEDTQYADCSNNFSCTFWTLTSPSVTFTTDRPAALELRNLLNLQLVLPAKWCVSGTDCTGLQRPNWRELVLNTDEKVSTHCSTLQHTTAHYSILQHITAHYNILQHTTTHNILQHTTYNTLHHITAHYNILQHTTAYYSTLQHTTTYYSTLQHTTTY